MTTAEQEPFDPAAIMAAHARHRGHRTGIGESCVPLWEDRPPSVPPCLPYRLADQMIRERATYWTTEAEASLAAENAALREQITVRESLLTKYTGKTWLDDLRDLAEDAALDGDQPKPCVCPPNLIGSVAACPRHNPSPFDHPSPFDQPKPGEQP